MYDISSEPGVIKTSHNKIPRSFPSKRTRASDSIKSHEKVEKAAFELFSFDKSLLYQAAMNIRNTACEGGAEVSGPIPLPNRQTISCVRRSVNGSGAAKDRFARTIHKCLVIISPFSLVSDKLSTLHIPNGVRIGPSARRSNRSQSDRKKKEV